MSTAWRTQPGAVPLAGGHALIGDDQDASSHNV